MATTDPNMDYQLDTGAPAVILSCKESYLTATLVLTANANGASISIIPLKKKELNTTGGATLTGQPANLLPAT